MLLLHVQFASYVLLLIWSIVLQVMGFSEVQGLTTAKAFGVWVLGQIIGFLASRFLALVVGALFPNFLVQVIRRTEPQGADGRLLPAGLHCPSVIAPQ